MMNLRFAGPAKGPLRILCLGAHCDDIEIGCGGTLLTLARSRRDIEVLWTVFCSSPARRNEEERAASLFLHRVRTKRITVHDFRDGFLPWHGSQVKELFELIKREFEPALIFTCRLEDRHQDHRTVAELTWNTFRDHLILEYEIPKFEGDLGTPNCFVPLTPRICREKAALIVRSFPSQRGKVWMAEDTFLSLARIRGIEAGGRLHYAEAFHCRKFSL